LAIYKKGIFDRLFFEKKSPNDKKNSPQNNIKNCWFKSLHSSHDRAVTPKQRKEKKKKSSTAKA
jgi:hypothetical protein